MCRDKESAISVIGASSNRNSSRTSLSVHWSTISSQECIELPNRSAPTRSVHHRHHRQSCLRDVSNQSRYNFGIARTDVDSNGTPVTW